MTAWTDQFVGDRMTVDREFTERVAASEFSSQEWGTIMTAVDLEIDRPESPGEARVVADTSRIDQVIPALEEMRGTVGGAGGAPTEGPGDGGAGGGSVGGGRGSDAGGGGLLDAIKRSLGLGSNESDQRAEAAAALAEEYAHRFQEHLEAQGKWERACLVAAESGDRTGTGFEAEAPATEDPDRGIDGATDGVEADDAGRVPGNETDDEPADSDGAGD